MQIQTGHIPLNKYLRRINKADLDNCTECIDIQGAHRSAETINHFIFECPAHIQARQELVIKIGRSHFQIAKIMKVTDHIKALVTYINCTGRFRNRDQQQQKNPEKTKSKTLTPGHYGRAL